MKKLGSALIGCMALGGAHPMAQASDDFDGTYVSLSTGVVHQQLDYVWRWDYPDSGAWYDEIKGMSRTGGAVRLEAGHGFHLAPRLHLGVSGFAEFGKRELGHYTYASGSPPTYTYTTQARLKNVRGLALEPGWALSANTLAYLRLGVASGQVELTSTYRYETQTELATVSKRVRGTTLGWGFKHTLTPRLFAGIEVSHTRYGKETVSLEQGAERVELRPRQTQGLVTLGYRF